jgi:hypothetical protein
MALPKQVQAQIAEIEELEKSLTAQKDTKAKPAKEEPEDEVQEETVEEESGGEVEEAAAPEEARPTDQKPKEVEDDFKQKYSTLKGKYDAEVPRLHQQVRQLTEQLDMFREELDAAKKAKEQAPAEKVSYVTDADREEFGEELIDVQRRVAKEVASEYEARIERQDAVIEALQKKLAQTGEQVGEMSFGQRLRQLVPDFDQVDADERWVAWLNEYDPMLRGQRRDQAQAAFNAGDAEAVAHYVKLWKQEITPVQEPARASRQAELEKQVAPNRSNSSKSVSSDRGAKLYSEREIQNAWNKVRVLNTRGQYDDAAKLEAEITAAYIEGRVRA